MANFLFDEAGVSVDGHFVRFGDKAMRVSEIKVVESGINSEDSDTAKVAWFFAGVLFLLGLIAPWLLILAVAAAGMAVSKQGEPAVHVLRVTTGGLFNSHAYQSTDGDHVLRLRGAIEAAMSANVEMNPRVGDGAASA